VRNIILTLLVIVAFTGQANASLEEAKSFVQKTADNTLAIVTDKTLSDDKKEESLDKLFESSVDIKWTAQFVLGHYWNETTPEQKDKYVNVYKAFLIKSYVPKFREYTDQEIIFKAATPEQEAEYMVQTEITNPGKAPIRVDYKVREDKGTYKIFDIIAEGVSMITTQRSDFGSILSRQGVDSLVKKLEEKTASNKK
jgi:phospholipid transport system substrate-binding protein